MYLHTHLVCQLFPCVFDSFIHSFCSCTTVLRSICEWCSNQNLNYTGKKVARKLERKDAELTLRYILPHLCKHPRAHLDTSSQLLWLHHQSVQTYFFHVKFGRSQREIRTKKDSRKYLQVVQEYAPPCFYAMMTCKTDISLAKYSRDRPTPDLILRQQHNVNHPLSFSVVGIQQGCECFCKVNTRSRYVQVLLRAIVLHNSMARGKLLKYDRHMCFDNFSCVVIVMAIRVLMM